MINLKSLYGFNSFNESTDRLMNLDLKFCVDNRAVTENHVFIAIVGEKYNPLKNLNAIVKSGCRFVVYEKNIESEKLIAEFLVDLVFIQVSSITKFIEEAGTAVANTFRSSGGKIIAISGSNGKTTTKEMLNFFLTNLATEDLVVSTQKNYNNNLGVPFTLFQIGPKTKFAIVELGSNHPGEIELLCNICKPQYGITTNIGDTHLEFFTNRENVFKEEAILNEYASELFLINSDDEYLKTLSKNKQFKDYGINGKDYKFSLAKKCIDINGTKFINTNITGSHNFINLGVAVVLIAEISGQKLDALSEITKSFMPTSNRSQWLDFNSKKVFLDAYNANPSSMIVAVSGFSNYLDEEGIDPAKSTLILGDMNELGENSKEFHIALGHELNQFKFGEVIFVGKFAEDSKSLYLGNASAYSSTEKLKENLNSHTAQSDYLMIKGSRSLQLETILDIK